MCEVIVLLLVIFCILVAGFFLGKTIENKRQWRKRIQARIDYCDSEIARIKAGGAC